MKFSEYIKDNPQSTRSNAKQLTGWVLAAGVEDAELEDYIAYIYRITLKDGSTYIGRRKLWVNGGAKPPSKYPRKKFNMSEWLTYCTSSKYVSNKVKLGDFAKAEIIDWCTGWAISSLIETIYICKEWESGIKNYNKQIEVTTLSKQAYLGKPCI